jgi:predicted DNA binding CopG/RHH family protein
MAKKKAIQPRLVIECSQDYLEQVKQWAAEEGFGSYANYIKFCISLHQGLKRGTAD